MSIYSDLRADCDRCYRCHLLLGDTATELMRYATVATSGEWAGDTVTYALVKCGACGSITPIMWQVDMAPVRTSGGTCGSAYLAKMSVLLGEMLDVGGRS